MHRDEKAIIVGAELAGTQPPRPLCREGFARRIILFA